MLALPLIAVLGISAQVPSEPSEPQYALVVANNESNDASRAALQYADDDGALYFELLEPQSEQAHLLTVMDAETQALHPGLATRSRPPTKSELWFALGDLNRRMSADKAAGKSPVLFLVFVGHGRRGPAGEGRVSLLGEDLTRTELYKQVLHKSKASTLHLIVDACDSYFLVNARGKLNSGPPLTSLVTQLLDSRSLSRFPNVGVLLSTSSEKESHEWSAIRSGVFSHQVRSGLAGAADVNGDGRVEYSELRAFVAAANAGITDSRGRVDLFAQPPAQNRRAPLADLTRVSRLRFVALPEKFSGHYWIENARGMRVVEGNKEADRTVVLALSSEEEHHLRTPTQEASFLPGPPRSMVDGTLLHFVKHEALAARGSMQKAFEVHLFETPFGPRFYAGFVASIGEPAVPSPERADLTP